MAVNKLVSHFLAEFSIIGISKYNFFIDSPHTFYNFLLYLRYSHTKVV
jgi:hypothetical protein